MRLYIALIFILSFTSCKTISYFNTPNDVFKENSAVYLTDGTVAKGMLTVNFETGRDAKDYIILQEGPADKKIKLANIEYYKIGNTSYHLKKVDVLLNDFQQLLFVKRLTPDSSRAHFYELYQQKSKSPDGREYYYYFVSLPGYDRLVAYNIASKYFQPKFDEKVSKMFLDCMPVATRIRNRESGFYLQTFTLSDKKKVAVWQRIIKEYNQCR
ncbi:MAG: hypothetical protein H7Y86_09170 [Rhizobacter sp.]|nr:hypothetical protein [Ferruginibacter sp.]